MEYREEAAVDSIRVTEDSHIEVRTANRVFKGDVEIAKTYHRQVLAPGDDLAGQDERVVAVADAVWTPEVLAGYIALNSLPD